jgi:ElaB/YqjD/DUF883 family membrane-anchored ribosome-binding protein
MNDRITGTRSEFTPQMEDLRAMARQDVAVARERLSEGRAILTDFVLKEPVKALGITFCFGVVLGWLIKRP